MIVSEMYVVEVANPEATKAEMTLRNSKCTRKANSEVTQGLVGVNR